MSALDDHFAATEEALRLTIQERDALRAEVAQLNALLQTRASELLEMQKAARFQQERAEKAEEKAEEKKP